MNYQNLFTVEQKNVGFINEKLSCLSWFSNNQICNNYLVINILGYAYMLMCSMMFQIMQLKWQETEFKKERFNLSSQKDYVNIVNIKWNRFQSLMCNSFRAQMNQVHQSDHKQWWSLMPGNSLGGLRVYAVSSFFCPTGLGFLLSLNVCSKLITSPMRSTMNILNI